MTNRVLIGNHATHGYGLYVSKENIDVTGSDNDHFMFDSTVSANTSSVSQVLFWHEVVYTDSVHNVAQTYDFDSYGNQCFAISFASTTAGASDDGADIRCLSQSTGSERAKAELGLHGGTLGLNESFSVPNYVVSVTNSGNTGTVSVTVTWPGGSGNDIAIQTLVLTEKI